MTIVYEDHRDKLPFYVPILREAAQVICANWSFRYIEIDIIHIDLRGDIERVTFYHIDNVHAGYGRPVGELGGAAAWECYRQLALLHPPVNHHFRISIP